jgi:hypothetical protein
MVDRAGPTSQSAGITDSTSRHRILIEPESRMTSPPEMSSSVLQIRETAGSKTIWIVNQCETNVTEN